MRVIAGSARRLPLETVDGMNTRPTTDRIKETLFNMLQMEVENSYFLDLYSGSGAIGIEALSRGAKMAVFVESDQAALNCLRHNLQFTKLADRARVMGQTVSTAIELLAREKKKFDIVFMDPPYQKELTLKTLLQLSDTCLVGQDTIVIAEAAIETDFSQAVSMGYEIIREKRYKTNKHVFLTGSIR